MVTLNISLLEKKYTGKDSAVLGKLECVIPSGQFVGIVGPSGAGKTTLLNMIANLEPLGVGQILLNNNPEFRHSDLSISYIFQQPRLMPWMTVYENLKLVAQNRTNEEINWMLARVGLENKANSYPRHLSGGMQRRVSIARAFLTNPDLLLLDEPFVSLDAPTAESLTLLLEELWFEHKPTVLFVTHHLEEAIRLSDRILFLSKSPGTLLLDKCVELYRPRSHQSPSVTEWKDSLLESNPGLLAGAKQPELTQREVS